MQRWVPVRGAVWAVLVHPGLWIEAMRAVVASVRHGWWRRPPYLPVPDGEYLSWRISTAYGSPDTTVDGDDVVGYLEWRRRQRRS